jgi:catechol 2,3-dioxygenase-like lactoylglutathione lyase family enzyme
VIVGLDHVIALTGDLDAAVRAYTAFFGRSPSWRGREGDTVHAWFQLSNMALDVIQPGSGPMRKRLEAAGEGLYGLGFATPDLAKAGRTLVRRGVTMFEPNVTTSTAADGATRAWSIHSASAKSTAGVPMFLVENDGSPPVLSTPVAEEAAAVSALDHVVINTPNPDRAMALYGAKLGLDLRLDRSNPDWGSRLLFFRCGSAVVEVSANLKTRVSDERDQLGGLAWRVADPDAAQARMAKAGFDVSDVRAGRKPGTRVFTLRSGVPGAPSLIIQQSAEPAGAE